MGFMECNQWNKRMELVIFHNAPFFMYDAGSTISTFLHGKINPKDWQVLSLGDAGFLQFFRVVSIDYGKPRDNIYIYIYISLHKAGFALQLKNLAPFQTNSCLEPPQHSLLKMAGLSIGRWIRNRKWLEITQHLAILLVPSLGQLSDPFRGQVSSNQVIKRSLRITIYTHPSIH